jgi:hypothetical protein
MEVATWTEARMEAATQTEADGGSNGEAEADGGSDPDGGVDGDRGGDVDGDASVEGGRRDAGPVYRIGPWSHQRPDSPPPPTARRLLPPLPPTARASLIHRFWAARLSSELTVVVKIRLWWDRDFRPRDSHLNFRPPMLRVPSLRVSAGYVSRYQK